LKYDFAIIPNKILLFLISAKNRDVMIKQQPKKKKRSDESIKRKKE
jgi:hypothetical protein